MGRDWVFGTQRHFEETPGLAATSTSTNTVAVSDYVFGTQVLTVPVGTELHWTSHDVVFHTVTGDDFTGILRPGSTFRHTFEEPGVHDYFCAVHPSMTGTIVVTEP
jgi:plastocyanin